MNCSAILVVLSGALGAFALGAHAEAPPTRWATVTVSSARVRARPTTESEQIGRLTEGTRVKLLQVGQSWCQVGLPDGSSGWVAKRLLQPEASSSASGTPVRKTATITVGAAHVRAGPGTEHRSLGVKPNGVVLPIVGYEGEWLQVKLSSGPCGWIRRDLVAIQRTPLPATSGQPQRQAVAKARVIGRTASLRDGPTESAHCKVVLLRGQTIYIFGRQGDWAHVRVHGSLAEGWIAGWLVQAYGAPRPVAPEPKPPAEAPSESCGPTG